MYISERLTEHFHLSRRIGARKPFRLDRLATKLLLTTFNRITHPSRFVGFSLGV